MRRIALYCNLFWILFSLVVCVEAFRLRLGTITKPGSGLFPFSLGMVMLVLSLSRPFPGDRKKTEGRQNNPSGAFSLVEHRHHPGGYTGVRAYPRKDRLPYQYLPLRRPPAQGCGAADLEDIHHRRAHHGGRSQPHLQRHLSSPDSVRDAGVLRGQPWTSSTSFFSASALPSSP